MNCDGSGWIGVDVGRKAHAEKCPGCPNCKTKDTTTSVTTTGSFCPLCKQWFPYSVGAKHKCLADLRQRETPEIRGI